MKTLQEKKQMKDILNKLYNHERLSKSEATQILKDIAAEKYNDAHLASFMTVFMMRPITADELSGFRNALNELAIKVDLSAYNTIDIVGTGGDGKDTFNISTLTSFIVAGEGMGPSKKVKAEKLAIPLMTESLFLDLLDS